MSDIDRYATIFVTAASRTIQESLEIAMARHMSSLEKDLAKSMKRIGYKPTVIGNIENTFASEDSVLPITLYTREKKVDGPTLLVVAGFHGDEPAGPLSVLSFIENNPDYISKANLSFLPIANPFGCLKLRRWGLKEMDPNRGFCRKKDKISEEGIALKARQADWAELAKDGLIDLHEDPDGKTAFVYTWNRGPINNLAKSMSKKQSMFFNLAPQSDMRKKSNWESVSKGIIHNMKNGGFEDWLFSSGTVPHIITTETPGLQRMNERVQCGAELIKHFIDYHIENKGKI
jgi:hypothetical protein